MITPAGSFIYPRGMDSTALRLAYRVNSAFLNDYSEVLPSGTNRTITSILQNQSAIPEGYATVGPWRQELYLTPPQNMFMGAALWKDALTTHEYRHAQQFMAYDQGWTRLYKVLFGNTGWLLSTVLNVPLWYREGDAVDSETRFTQGGRGTLPAFNMEYRTLRLNGIDYEYDKAISASNFKDFVPNMYRSGYYMTRKLRAQYGQEAWANVLDKTSQKFMQPFSRTLKEVTGEDVMGFYLDTFSELDSVWALTDTVAQVVGTRISARSDVFEKYRFPQIDGQGNLIVSHESFNDIRAFYQLKTDGCTRKLKTAGIYTSDHYNFTVENNLMTWAESAFHPRYINKTYSVIKYRDLESGTTKQISHRSKYFSPAPSKDGKLIAVVEYDEQERCAVKLVDVITKQVVRSISYYNHFLTQPRWISENELVMVSITDEGNQLVKLNLSSDIWTVLLKAYDINISKPFGYKNDIFFSSGLSGIENIYKLNPESGSITQLTNARFGAFDPFVYQDTLYFSNYDKNGYEIWQTSLQATLNKTVVFPEAPFENSLADYHNHEIIAQVDRSITVDTVYNKYFWNKLFSVAGWTPLVFPPELGIELYTLNMERSLKSTIGMNYNLNEEILQSNISLSYAKFFPIFHGTFSRRGRKILQPDPVYEVDDIPEYQTNETIVGGGVEVPLRLTQGVYRTNVGLRGDFNHHRVDELEGQPNTIEFNSTVASLTFERFRPAARRQVKSPFAQIIQAKYKYGIEEAAPSQLFVNGQLYFPGLFKTHSLNFRGAYEDNENTQPYRYLSTFKGSRGYEYYPFTSAYLISANYELPLFYPDYYIPNFLGVTRVRLNAFYDYSEGKTPDFTQLQRSAGIELLFDLRVFRAFNMDLGLQFTQVEDHVDTQRPFVFNIVVNYFELLN
ncbi:MAG: hypothetical protein DHS20C17_24510 [Cyclobacteriaceae bacterium]|nr:MAG: hypothetical protein DHS20C17_24510 [Cyclobacteriaceae bacterium]